LDFNQNSRKYFHFSPSYRYWEEQAVSTNGNSIYPVSDLWFVEISSSKYTTQKRNNYSNKQVRRCPKVVAGLL